MPSLKVARLLFPVKNLGPGNRIGIWLYGCERGCRGCANMELWNRPEHCDVEVDFLIDRIRSISENPKMPEVDGITISGGEPFLQTEGLEAFVNAARKFTDDILIFSGFFREDLKTYEKLIISKIAVLVDGPYEEDLNNGHPLKGSDNQTIYVINPAYKEAYERFIAESTGKNRVQIFPVTDGNLAIGIHKRDFIERYEQNIRERGNRIE